MASIDLTSGTAGAYGAGELQLQNKVQMTTTLTFVTDNLNVASPLLLSTNSVTSRGLANEVGSTAYGTTALRSTTTGTDNTAIGYNALNADTTGSSNTGVGHEALLLTTTGNHNTSLGKHANRFNLTGTGNTGIGSLALRLNSTGTGNTGVGYLSLENNTNSNNTGIGYRSLRANTSGTQNVGVGVDSLLSNTTGNSNTGLGYRALNFNTTGFNNTAVGRDSGYDTTTGSNNTSVGVAALLANTTGSNNTAIGEDALIANVTGGNNTALGQFSLSANTTGIANTALGYNTGLGITTGNYNTILGANVTGLSATLSNNIILADGQGNQRINVISNGNVGIGTASPQYKLSVSGGSIGVLNSGVPALELYRDLDVTIVGTAGQGMYFGARNGSTPTAGAAIFGALDNPATTGVLAFQTLTGGSLSTKMTITSTGNVGIGTTTPSNLLHLYKASEPEIYIQDSVSTFRVGLNSDNEFFVYTAQAEDIYFSNNNAERLRITSNGYVRLASGTGGIQFNGDTAAANALDDYEEGTFTPTLAFGGTGIDTYNTRNGYYTKIGNTVNFTIFIQVRTKGAATGATTVSGLPFTSVNIADRKYSINVTGESLVGLTGALFGLMSENATSLALFQSDSTGGVAVSDLAFLDFSTDNIIVTGTYQA